MDYLSASMFLPGERASGQDVRTNNVEACVALAGIVRTTLGPVGLDKMLVDDVGDVAVTNDGATILKSLAVEHPAAQVLVELSELQDREVGDGTTSVVVLAAELLRRANALIKNSVHPTNIMQGYRLASSKAIAFLKKYLLIEADSLTREDLIRVAKTSMSSKVLSLHSSQFAEMAVDTLLGVATRTTDEDGVQHMRAPPSSINILKAHGESLTDSFAVNGYALNSALVSPQMPTRIGGKEDPERKPAIAFLDMSLKRLRLLSAEILISGDQPGADMSNVRDVIDREVSIVTERINKIIAAGANVILVSGSMDDGAIDFLVARGCMGARRVEAADLRRLARFTGGTVVSDLADLEGGESFDPSMLGTCDEVVEEFIADSRLLFFRNTTHAKSGSIILRGPTTHMLDELDRSLHDALCAVSRAMESSTLVVGGGAVEASLSVFLENYASTVEGREGVAVHEFARALTIIPKQLALNAGQDATELVAQLRSAHSASQTRGASDEAREQRFVGLDLEDGTVRNNREAGVLEPAVSKLKSIQFATEAAITILRIDDVIKLTPEKRDKGRQ